MRDMSPYFTVWKPCECDMCEKPHFHIHANEVAPVDVMKDAWLKYLNNRDVEDYMGIEKGETGE